MTKQLSMVLLGLGAVVVLVSLLTHFFLKANIFPHFSIVIGVLGLILAAIGGFGITQKTAQQ